MQIFKSIQITTNNILRHSKCFILMLKNVVLLRMLRVNLIELYDQIVIQGNEVELEWSIKGCHKIKINGVGILSGNINGIKYRLLNINEPIDICFYGVAKKQRIKIFYHGVKIELKKKFEFDLLLPLVNTAPETLQPLDSHFSNLQLNPNLNNVSIAFDTFDKHNYKP
jgi:hypothetical protein